MIFTVLPHDILGYAALNVGILTLYWLPTIVALWARTDLRRDRSPNVGQVATVNGLLGWSGVGWVVSLVMALRKPAPVFAAPR